MFNQLLTPVGDSLPLSFLVAALPIVTVLTLLGVARRPAWQASLAGLAVGFVVAVTAWQFPLNLAINSVAMGVTFALWPVMWIVLNTVLLYNITVRAGSFDSLRNWMLSRLPNDRRVVLVIIGFSFSALLEGTCGFGTPVAITTAMLIALGFPAMEALVYTLIFNTAPVAFGGFGLPIITLAGVVNLPDTALAAMAARQLPIFALLLPFYVVGFYAGWKSMFKIWPVLLVAGGSFAVTQFVMANYVAYNLTDVTSAMVSMVATIGFLKVWKLPEDPAFALNRSLSTAGTGGVSMKGWMPWIFLTVIVIAWTIANLPVFARNRISWPGLDNQVFITLYNAPYRAIWDFQPLATGTAILVSAIVTAIYLRVSLAAFFAAVVETWVQIRIAVLTVVCIIGLAYLMNYSGLNYTLGLGVASVGPLFPLLSASLGWLAVFLSGSDTAGNALFGNLQVIAARQLNLDPVLMAATNSSGGVFGKMISPQNISTGAAMTEFKGKEGAIFARTFKHSIALTLVLGVIVYLQQYVFPGMIPAY